MWPQQEVTRAIVCGTLWHHVGGVASVTRRRHTCGPCNYVREMDAGRWCGREGLANREIDQYSMLRYARSDYHQNTPYRLIIHAMSIWA